MLRRALPTLILLPLMTGLAMAQGLIIPDEPDLPPLALTRHAVKVQIDRQGATTTVEQVFVNNTERKLEAQYVFPIPKGAAMSKFSMLVDGKEKLGEMVDKDKARAIYSSMVHRTQEPALLEYLGSDLFRASIFPIEPHANRTITLRYEQVLPAENSLVSYVYPVRNGARRGATVLGEFSLEATIQGEGPISNIYSPSHPVTVQRADERTAKASFSEKNVTLDRDFQLYYSVSDKDVGLSLVTYRPDPKQPGYFMMLISPKSKLQSERIVARDIVFVVDTSGSMAGEKIQQARNALKYCVSNLNESDRFNIVTFSTDVYRWKPKLVPAGESRDAALSYIDTIIARGGTAIADALEMALSFPKDPSRPYFVIFMTDGKPTIGEADPDKILNQLAKSKGEPVRIFTWGVGYEVDTHLLDGIAAATGGVSEYVHPEEDIAAKVAGFYNKASHPVLTDVELKVLGDKIQLVNLHPNAPSDLYAGSQLVVMGRYTGEGDVSIRLTGRVNDKTETFEYNVALPASEKQHAFIEALWAKREIGHLLDAIRLHGEKKELVDDVIRLSVEYGIQTPYTSYLILEDGTHAAADKGESKSPSIRGGAGGADEKKVQERLDAMYQARPQSAVPPAKPEDDRDRREHNEAAKSLAEGFKSKDGKSAVDTAAYLRKLKESERADSSRIVAFKKAAGTRFFEYRGMWVDVRFDADQAMTCVKFGSAAYFKLIERHPEIVEALKIGTTLVFVTAPGHVLSIEPKGAEDLSDGKIAELFGK